MCLGDWICPSAAALGKGSFASIPAATDQSCDLQITMSMGNSALKIGDRAQAFGVGAGGMRGKEVVGMG